VEDLLQAARDESLVFGLGILVEAIQGVRLARASLPVGHDGCILPVEDALDCVPPGDLVDVFLRRVGGVDPVIRELGLALDLGLGTFVIQVRLDQLLNGERLHAVVDLNVVPLQIAEFLQLPCYRWPHSYHNFKIIFLIQKLIISS